MQSARLDFSVSLPFVVSKRRSQLYEFGLSLTESAVVSEPQALCEFNSVVEMKAIVFRRVRVGSESQDLAAEFAVSFEYRLTRKPCACTVFETRSIDLQTFAAFHGELQRCINDISQRSVVVKLADVSVYDAEMAEYIIVVEFF